MRVCYGWAKTPLRLSTGARYFPEHLMGMIMPYLRTQASPHPLLKVPIWINLDDQYIRLESQQEILLACRLACIHHNTPDSRSLADEDWLVETAEMESRAAEFYAEAGGEEAGDDSSGDYVRVENACPH